MKNHKNDQSRSIDNAEQFSANMIKAASEYSKIFSELWEKQNLLSGRNSFNIDPFSLNGTFSEALSKIMVEPEKMLKSQFDFQERYVELWDNLYARYVKRENVAPLYEPDSKDRRFKDEAWECNPFFDFMRQSYLLTYDWMTEFVSNLNHDNDLDGKKINFYTKYILDSISPSNFIATNPEVLKTALETNGESIVKGLHNFYKDLQNSADNFAITTTDHDAFRIGENLATTKGEVVFQNDLMQLIQYYPSTEQTYQVPLLIIPAWINKYYILDLQEKNSLIKWLVDQGYTVFVISWVNPGRQHAEKGFEDYITEGPIAALDVIEKITGSKQISAIGYCLGGTLLSVTLSYLQSISDNRIVSATFLTTLLDFKNAGDMCVFIDQSQIRHLEKKMSETGYFSAEDMSAAFSLLRANDMIWSFFVNNYLLGKDPFPFDLLYWNADTTNLPSKMHSFYIRNMYQDNNLVELGKLNILGKSIDLSKIKVPSYFLSTKDDHIAPWENTFRATDLFAGPLRFVLSESGHIAGVVNPVNKNKYGHWINDNISTGHQSWFKNATKKDYSWWNDWLGWNQQHAGDMVKALIPNTKEAIEPAPGHYVLVKADNV